MPDPFDPIADPAATAARHLGLQHAPAAQRNREPICQMLAELLPATPCTVLEIASGTIPFDKVVGRQMLPSCGACQVVSLSSQIN